jgi:hypothetical protein
MKCILPMLIALLVILPITSSAFDGERKGLAVGGGLGVAPVAQFSTKGNFGRSTGLALQFVVGYAWSSHNLLALEVNGAFYANDQFNSSSLLSEEDFLTSQGFEGAAWYHYFGTEGESLFTATGLGLYSFNRGRHYHSDRGAGYLIGGGFEFLPHFQIGLYFSGGRTFDAGHNFGHKHFSILISGVKF